MGEKLIIRNFGPIKDMELDLGKVTVLIGEQASGKSTVAKVLAMCRYFSYLVMDSRNIVNGRSEFSRTALVEWGLEEYETPETYIKYDCPDYSVVIDQHRISGSSFAVSYDSKSPTESHDFEIDVLIPNLTPRSDRFKELLNRFEELKPSRESKFAIPGDWSIPHSFLTTDVKRVMNNPFYFPTERGLQSIFSLGKSSIQNLSDSLYNQFALLDRISKEYNSETEIEPLNIQYRNENGVGYVKKKSEERFYRLSSGASGYQSATPIVLAVDYYSTISRKRTFVVEEPEQNLFPEAQKKLVEFLVDAAVNDKHQMLFTTHSPYILSALENLMYAHKLGNIEGRKYAERVENIIAEKYWIDQNEVSVYALENGGARSIVLRDEPMIDKEYIDSVSNILNAEFDHLLSIDVERENGGKS